MAVKSVPVLVRVIEWMEWLPAENHELGETVHPQTGQKIEQKMALHEGHTGFLTDANERLVELHINGTAQFKTVTTENADGEEEEQLYGLYVFQALVARNGNKPEFESLVLKPRIKMKEYDKKKKDEGRDKRGDLVIVENKPDIPSINSKGKGH